MTGFQCVTRHERSETKSQISPQFSCVTDFQFVTRHGSSETKSEILYDRFSMCHMPRASIFYLTEIFYLTFACDGFSV